MSTLKVNTINAATSGQAVAVDVQNPKSFRRINPNGAMNIAQRGTSDTSSSAFLIDRWKHSHGGADEAPTYSQHALTSSDTGPWEKGFRYSFHIQNGNQTGGAGASDYIQCETRIEAQDIAQSGWDYNSTSSYITLSFWVKSSVAQAFPFTLQTSDGTAHRYAFTTGSLSANTWTKVTKTIPGNSNLTFNNDNGIGLYIYFWPYMGTTWTGTVTENAWFGTSGNDYCNDITTTWWEDDNATFEVTGVQLEVGEYPTEFEFLDYGTELLRCQRYYWNLVTDDGTQRPVFNAQAYNSSTCYGNIHFPCTMRAHPSIEVASGSSYYLTYGNNASTGATTVGLEKVNKSSAELTVSGSFTQGYAYFTRTVASNGAKVSFVSEI